MSKGQSIPRRKTPPIQFVIYVWLCDVWMWRVNSDEYIVFYLTKFTFTEMVPTLLCKQVTDTRKSDTLCLQLPHDGHEEYKRF
jgi:hypothetical protein